MSHADICAAEIYLPRCRNAGELSRWVADVDDNELQKKSTSERAVIVLFRQGGSWSWNIYLAIPEAADRLLHRLTGYR